MRVVRTRQELIQARAGLPVAGPVGFVPTMGALHAGHRALLESASADCDAVLVSIFVNPLQFGPNEDIDRYPRALDEDLAACRAAGSTVVFAPSVAEMYPTGPPRTAVDPGPLGAELEGQVRPEHFRGVLTIVARLLQLARPDAAYFGEKDYQQLVLIRQMVDELDMGVRIIGCPTVREPGGLALSSRNRYLSAPERERAGSLIRALRAGVAAGPGGAEAVLNAARGCLTDLEVDYLTLRAPDLGPAPERGPARLLVAARVGTTRLIDNIPVLLGEA
ncbi:MAG: pantoate--beta-alanine ligase [Actinobacteria bacterium]|nr:pantoate--beta-alanine ligase [Actinomycetota bacterium]MBI3687485.1 pantoate--beta-alanine ligase [Actinomycetota bacterium]